MPRREDIERFTQVLNSLGDEPAVRAARSEIIDEVPPPGEETATPDSGELDSLGPEAEGTAETGTTRESESLQDIFESLSALPDDDAVEQGAAEPGAAAGGGAQSREAAGEPAAPGPADEGLDFSSLFGEEAAPEGIEELEKPAPPEEDAFSLPESEAGSLEADLSQMETLPEEEAQGEPGALGTEGSTAGGEAFDDLGSFSLEAPETTTAGQAPTEPVPGGEAGGGESFDLPDLGDLSFGEAPEEPPAADAGSAEPSFDDTMPSLDEPAEEAAFDASTPSREEPSSFEEPMPSLDVPASEEPAPSLEEPMASMEEPAIDQGAISGFDLDTATLAEPGSEGELGQLPSEMAAEAPGLGEEPEPSAGGEMESLGEESLQDLNLDQFSLPESAEEFGAPGAPATPPKARPTKPPRQQAEEPRQPRQPRPQPRPLPRAPVAPSEPGLGEGEIELTPEQFARLRKSLETLPRNLEIVVQDLIGEGTASGADLTSLLNLLLRDASAQEIAALAGRISGKRIRIPAGYEKRTGAAFEAEQRTFAYAFRENFLPLLRVIAITVLAGGAFGFLGYNYVYRPLYSYTNYRAGYTQIMNDRYALANERFARATSVWPLKGWYYKYAEAFAVKRQYGLAEKKYEELLKAYPGDRKGILDYARFESTQMSAFEKADALLKQYLDVHQDDFDALLAAGDNDLLWADRDTSKFAAARLAYAVLIEKYGARDELLFRMLRYFIRTNNYDEAERLRAFYATKPEVVIDAAVYAELGGYLVDHRRLDYVLDVLFRADKVHPGLFEVHYNLARYYRIVQNSADEKKALDATAQILDRTKSRDPITRRRLDIEIDTRTRLGEYHYRAGEYIPAERELQAAIRLVEYNQKNRMIDRNRLYGRPYAVLGDLYYYITGDLDTAAVQFRNAISNLYTDPLLTYKIGYVQYHQKDYKSALSTFSSAEDASAYPSGNEALAPVTDIAPAVAPSVPGQPPQNLLYALGDTFYHRGDYFAAQGYFLRLLERLQSRRAAAGFLHPEDRPDDRALLESLVRVNNNLGVTTFRLAERTGDRNRRSEALAYLSFANEIASSLARSPDTVKRSEDRNLSSLNMKEILYPAPTPALVIFDVLPKDFDAMTW
jgi:hypothetical protein